MQIPSDSQVSRFKRNVYDKYLQTLSEHIAHRCPDVELLEAFSLFDASTVPEELELHGSHGQSELKVLNDHYSPHNVVHPEAGKSELKVFNSIVAANSELKQLPPRELMTRMLRTQYHVPQPQQVSFHWISSSNVHKREFSALSRIKTNICNRLSSKVLNNLMMIAVEGPAPEEFPYDQACDICMGSLEESQDRYHCLVSMFQCLLFSLIWNLYFYKRFHFF